MKSRVRPPFRLKPNIPRPFWATTQSISLNRRPDLPAIAGGLGFDFETLDGEFIDAIAHNQALLVEEKNIDLTKHLQLWAERDPQVHQTKSFFAFQRAFSAPVYHRNTEWGLVILADSSHELFRVRFWGVELLFLPWAIAECPKIADDLVLPEEVTLHGALRRGLSPLFERYDGPGDICLEGPNGFYPAAMRLHVVGNENEVLNSALVANGLVKVLGDVFDKLVCEIAARTVEVVRSFSQNER